MHGYIPSAAKWENNKHIKYHMQSETNRSDFFFFFLNKPHSCNLPPKGSQNALVVSCSTRTIKVDWKTSFYASYAWLSILPPAPSQLKGCEPRIRADSEELTNPGTLPLVPESSLCGGSSGLPAPFLSSLFPTTRCT